jgi:hypothetical protein
VKKQIKKRKLDKKKRKKKYSNKNVPCFIHAEEAALILLNLPLLIVLDSMEVYS